MTKRLHQGAIRRTLLFGFLSLAPSSFGMDLSVLNKGRNVHLAMIGNGPLCDAKVDERARLSVTLRLLKTTAECGRKGETIRLANERILELVPQKRLTRKRIAAKLLLGAAGVAALAVFPLTSPDPESWLVLENGVVPGFVMFGAWRAVPQRQDYLLLMACPDSRQCFAH
jgi:hypothetical protein